MAQGNQEAFIKSQLVAFYKAVNKVEAPLKQKHVRALIVGTHKLRSGRIFWYAVSRIQLEKNPVFTWKFCQLLHKLIHDGHRKVTEDSIENCPRLEQLGNFWQHLRTSYGQANTSYCNMLMHRLQFHKKYPSIPGSLYLTESQLDALTSDENETYELTIDVLDQMDELLGLKTTVMTLMETLRFSSLVPQGQCLLAPLILVVLDSSKFYDFLVKALFKLHSKLPPDTLIGHRERFYDIFRRTKKFYEEASTYQYFKYLVSIPTLPRDAPNFEQASDLASYQAPQAYLHATASSEGGDVSPPDAQSICEENIVDLSNSFAVSGGSDSGSLIDTDSLLQQPSQPLFDPKDEIIGHLRHDLDTERETKERLIQEASVRIEQYENRLVQMKQEIDSHKQLAEERLSQLEVLRSASAEQNSREQQQREQEEAENGRKAHEYEEKFKKMSEVYTNLRGEHIKALTQVKELRDKLEDTMKVMEGRAQEYQRLSQNFEQINQEKSILESQSKVVEERMQTNSESLNETQEKASRLESEIQQLSEQLERMRVGREEDAEFFEQKSRDDMAQERQNIFGDVCSAAVSMLEQSLEDLQNATSISYPTHLAANSLRMAIDSLTTFIGDSDANVGGVNFLESGILFAHKLSEAVVGCAAAAYTASIQHFEPVNEQCRRVISTAIGFYSDLKKRDSNNAKTQKLDDLKMELAKLEVQVKELPTQSGEDLDTVGTQLDEEMARMEKAIEHAVKQIEELQEKSRQNNTGLRLEVNDKILGACTSLMDAVRQLVRRSHDVQEEIVAAGRGSASTTDFYKRNHLWSEGLLSAARAVGVAANVLMSSADGLIMGKGKFEQLIVAAQEIGASVAQLFVSSRVKADKGSQKLAELGTASKAVNRCTAAVVAEVKSAQQELSDEKLLDFSHFSLHEAKKEEMESQVRTLELEAELGKERARLSALRKQHYHLASLVVSDSPNGNGAT